MCVSVCMYGCSCVMQSVLVCLQAERESDEGACERGFVLLVKSTCPQRTSMIHLQPALMSTDWVNEIIRCC